MMQHRCMSQYAMSWLEIDALVFFLNAHNYFGDQVDRVVVVLRAGLM
jgi:hypothetical protein